MTQHVPVPPRRLALSDHEKPDSQRIGTKPRTAKAPARLAFRWEPFSSIVRELSPLFKQHWREIALDRQVVPLDPDWASYYDLEFRGNLHILTARLRDGQVELLRPKASGAAEDRIRQGDFIRPLVGYIFNLIGGHQHYAGTRFAHTEMFWLHPDYRKGWEPVRMFKENIAGLKEREAVISTINFKLHFQNARVGKLLARLGYEATDIVMRRVLC